MCLAVPGRILEITDKGEPTAMGKVSFSGLIREVSLGLTPEADVGDYVIVHAGFAISTLDEAEARKVFEELERLDAALERPEKPE